MNEQPGSDPTCDYGPEYYASHCGDAPYSRDVQAWLDFYAAIATEIVRSLTPQKVFDAGCAIGFLVEALWDRGVETHGRDISAFAISQVRPDVRSYCAVGSIADPIEGNYDLVLCIEVLEHMPPAEALRAVASVTASASRILFSSSPIDFDEPTHVNVRPTIYWLRAFRDAAFAPVVEYDAGYVSPHAMLLQRREGAISESELFAVAELVRQRLRVADLQRKVTRLTEAEREALRERDAATAAHSAAERAEADIARAEADLARSEARAARTKTEAMRRDTIAARAIADAERMRFEAARDEADAALAARAEASARAEAAQTALVALQAYAGDLRGQIAAIQTSTSWRMTSPARRILRRSSIAKRLGRSTVRALARIAPSITANRRAARRRLTEQAAMLIASGEFDPVWYLQQNVDIVEAGIDPVTHYLEHGKAEGRLPRPECQPVPEPKAPLPEPISQAEAAGAVVARPSAAQLIQRRFSYLEPLAMFDAPHEPARVTVVTDGINVGSSFGGVGTSLIMAAQMAKRLNAAVRVVTRTDPADAANFGAVLAANQVLWDGNVDFVHSAVEDGQPVAVGPDDVFLTTSWWTTAAVRRAVNPARIICLVQEDERMFYPHGDDRLRCHETLSDPAVRMIVNSRLLFEHFVDGPEPLADLRDRAVWFEPAFPASILDGRRSSDGSRRRRFFFYARPNNLRNLYWRGLEAIAAVMEDGLLDPEEWDVFFVGRGLEELVLPGGVTPHLRQNLPWAEYTDLVRTMDAGLCLMDTPHPSYPPLDLAASGAAVVTNRHGRKTSLLSYSSNILCVEPTVVGLKQGIKDALAMASDIGRRTASCREGIETDWASALAPVLEFLLPKQA
ncbi:MAG TPA: methyltransferase domain-containing protein [Acidobacteriaceae bacterium]